MHACINRRMSEFHSVLSWVLEHVRRVVLKPVDVASIVHCSTSGRIKPPQLSARRQCPVDPITLQPMPLVSGNGIYCTHCHRLASVEATTRCIDREQEPRWRAAYKDDDTWYFMEENGQVPVIEAAVVHRWPISGACSEDDFLMNNFPGDFFEYDRANTSAGNMWASGVVDEANVLLTHQLDLNHTKCIWCRNSTGLEQVTIMPVCEGSGTVCLSCRKVLCSRCTKHNCLPFSSRVANLQVVYNADDFCTDHCCDKYRLRIYPKQFASRCHQLAKGPCRARLLERSETGSETEEATETKEETEGSETQAYDSEDSEDSEEDSEGSEGSQARERFAYAKSRVEQIDKEINFLLTKGDVYLKFSYAKHLATLWKLRSKLELKLI